MIPVVEPSQFDHLFTNAVPLLDVRAPVEFAQGAFPTAHNLPLLNDSERARVGLTYKQSGQQAAIDLGHQLVSGHLRAERIEAWRGFVEQHPQAVLYCFRGGLRSRIVQQWLAEAGVTIPRVGGGYKALRRHLLSVIEEASRFRWIVLGGRTGCGKTRLLNELPNAIDLEGLAAHRGSAFGGRVVAQPTQIDFENHLAVALLSRGGSRHPHLLVEDEGRAIGSLAVPLSLHQAMRQAPLAVLEAPFAERAEVILQDYIHDNYLTYRHQNPEQGALQFADYLRRGLLRIRKRLGESSWRAAMGELEDALQEHARSGDFSGHRRWIERLLRDYYDPMYDYQLGTKLTRVVFRGDRDAFLAWANRLAPDPSGGR